MESLFNINHKTIMNRVLDELIMNTRCQYCDNVLDGSWWDKNKIEIAKPSFMELEYCSFVCEREFRYYNPGIY